jgi:hypothetical protein
MLYFVTSFKFANYVDTPRRRAFVKAATDKYHNDHGDTVDCCHSKDNEDIVGSRLSIT